MPALPPDDDTNRVLPARAWLSHTAPMPRNLNEPTGCKASSFSHTVLPVCRLSGRDCSTGVWICSGMDYLEVRKEGRQDNVFCHPWIPAFAGMTEVFVPTTVLPAQAGTQWSGNPGLQARVRQSTAAETDNPVIYASRSRPP